MYSLMDTVTETAPRYLKQSGLHEFALTEFHLCLGSEKHLKAGFYFPPAKDMWTPQPTQVCVLKFSPLPSLSFTEDTAHEVSET